MTHTCHPRTALAFEVEVCLCTCIYILTLCITNNSSLFEVKTSLCKLGLRCESAVSSVVFPSHSPQSMPKQTFNMIQQNVWVMWCGVRFMVMYAICVLAAIFTALVVLIVDSHCLTSLDCYSWLDLFGKATIC